MVNHPAPTTHCECQCDALHRYGEYPTLIDQLLDDLTAMHHALEDGTDPALLLIGDTLRTWVSTYRTRRNRIAHP